MRIFLDIGHPAHVHYFRNWIKLMESRGHFFFVTARHKEVAHQLLHQYQIPYKNRGTGKSTLLGKIVYSGKADRILWQYARKFKPDLFLSFASPYIGHVSGIMRKPHISFTDTENARLGILSFAPFADVIMTPACFQKDFGNKHIRFNSYMELGYLAPNYFTPQKNVLKQLNVDEDEKYVLLRFVSWGATHDMQQSGFLLRDKINLVDILKDHARIFISSEAELPDDLEKYRIKIPPHLLHDALAHASLYIGEGATTASECVMLGTPAFYVNPLNAGTLEEQAGYGLLYNYRSPEGVPEKALEILSLKNSKDTFRNKRLKLLCDKTDITAFAAWFIENYPESFRIMKENPGYQYRFKNPIPNSSTHYLLT